MELNLPDYVKSCLQQLENNGYEAWCVGGAVRDLIMGKTPFDYDITTNASPETVVALFPKTVPTGIKHGTVTVVTDGGNIEVTTYRSDGLYLDNRAPENVTFVKNIDEDLKRRDFTVNAICYNPRFGIYDPLNGINDIRTKTIRAIGEPDVRFSEDALRIMRAFRFSAQLGFSIDLCTLQSAIKLSHLLKNISVERIFCEFKRILTSQNPECIIPLLEYGGLEFLGLKQCEIPPILKNIQNDFALRFSVFCFKNELIPSDILKVMKTDNFTLNSVYTFIRILVLPIPKCKTDIKKILYFSNAEMFEKILSYYRAIGVNTLILKKALQEIIINQEPYSIKMLAVTGDDLLKMGFKGKEIGNKLEFLLNQVIKNCNLNTKDQLLNLIKM